MNPEEVKSISNLKNSKHDSYIKTMLPLMEEAVQDYCNNPFKDDNGKDKIPGGAKIAIAKWIEYNTIQAGLASRSQGVSYSYDTNVPESIKTLLRPYKRVRF